MYIFYYIQSRSNGKTQKPNRTLMEICKRFWMVTRIWGKHTRAHAVPVPSDFQFKIINI